MNTKLVAVAAIAFSLPALAFAQSGGATVTGAHGGTATSNRTAGDVSSTATGRYGETSTREVDRYPGGATAMTTGPRGQSATRNTVRSNGDVASSTQFSNGQTATRSVDRSTAGTLASSTGPRGATVNRSRKPR